MIKHLRILAISLLKRRVAKLNEKLSNSHAGEQVYLYESGTKYCVLALVDTKTHMIRARFGVNAQAKRDQCLAKAFLNLIENTRVPNALPLAA
ncbi:MAG: hypothetical protein MK214_15125 [Thalassotalea sp.]|nr:hypothetical protein [Thalassotalea sp.]